jgi:antitoxin component of MazEF toxin-antitoxin module
MRNTATLSRWGNSFGIRIPKGFVTTSHAYAGEVFEIVLKTDGRFILTPIKKPRTNWTAAFNAQAAANKDAMLIGDLENDFDRDEWTW